MTALVDPDARIVIVGAGLAGLRAAEALRAEGFGGSVTVVGDEAERPYDRPPLSKQVLTGLAPADHTTLPRLGPLDGVEWKLGTRAIGLDRERRTVRLDGGEELPYDRCLIATGLRARPWHKADEAALDGVFVIHTMADATALRARLAAGPRRVVVIGGGFTGSEMASVCRMLDIDVSLVELGAAPLVGALGGVIGEVAAAMQRDAGVDLHCGVGVDAITGEDGRVTGVRLSDGTDLDAEIVVVALGGIRNTEWLHDSGLAAGQLGVGCDAGCRVADANAIVTDDIFVAGDVATFPAPLFRYQRVALEHWRNALVQAQVAAHNMVCAEADRRPHVSVPWFWSIQFEVNIKSVGIPNLADEVVVTQGSTQRRHFVAAYGMQGTMVGAVSFNNGRVLEHYERLIAAGAPFPPELGEIDDGTGDAPQPSAFPPPSAATHGPTTILTGNSPADLHVEHIWSQEVSA
jgi:NADPH-dependent 2,4-dienoyl-CoA reductase/sulfur reductase-like enzyme